MSFIPMVALYWFENRLLTYWFIRDVFPTLIVSAYPGSNTSSRVAGLQLGQVGWGPTA